MLSRSAKSADNGGSVKQGRGTSRGEQSWSLERGAKGIFRGRGGSTEKGEKGVWGFLRRNRREMGVERPREGWRSGRGETKN